MKKADQLRARATLWRQRAEALDREAQILEDTERTAGQTKVWDEVEAVAQRALNGWDTDRMRQAMPTVRELQGALSKHDWEQHKARIFALDKLFGALRDKIEKVEKARLVKRLYVEHPGSSAKDIEQMLAAKWEVFKLRL